MSDDNGRLAYIAPPLRGLARPVGTLAEDPANTRLHGERNIGTIKGSLQRFGQQKPIVIDRKGIVIAGNGTLQAARELGWDHIAVVESELDGPDRTAYAIADNRTAELAEWDDKALAATLAELQATVDFDHAVTGFDNDEIDALIAADLGQNQPEAPEPQVDRAAELQAKWKVERGQVWELAGKAGVHRVMCGDATKEGDVGRLMNGTLGHLVVTDPPYGVAYDGGTTKREALAGDQGTQLYPPACAASFKHTDQTAPLYLFHAGVKGFAAAAAAAAAGYEIRCELVWNKNQAQYGALSAQYKQKHEPFYYCYKKGKAPRWFGPTTEVTVWDCDRAQRNEHHPTQKPPELIGRAIRNSSESRQLVCDWFLGSGTTMVAAEQLGRICYGMEIEPKYVAVTLERLADMELEPKLADG